LIKGQRIHRDDKWNFSFWRPLNWHQYETPDKTEVIYYPETDPRTCFYVSAIDLGASLESDISKDDLPALRAGLIEGIKDLPNCILISEKEISKEKAIGYEFIMTFDLDGFPCKRRLWMLYLDRCQFTIYGQGVPPEDYDVFKHVLNYMYLTLTFSDLSIDMGVPQMPDFSKPSIFSE
jgi:hypothetical protein